MGRDPQLLVRQLIRAGYIGYPYGAQSAICRTSAMTDQLDAPYAAMSCTSFASSCAALTLSSIIRLAHRGALRLAQNRTRRSSEASGSVLRLFRNQIFQACRVGAL